MSVTINDPVGSRWHRWDPHLHAPGTLLSDQFGGNWEAYLTRIESSSPPIVALGVTDYFCIRTYREVKARRAEGRLPAVAFMFPNVELRLETKTADKRAINIHLLFSPHDADHENQIERILAHLSFDYDGVTYRCTADQLAALGKHHDPSQQDYVAAMRVGANQFKTTLKDLKWLFKNERWMRENALVAVASKTGDGTAGLQHDDAFAATRLELERFADAIFSSRDKDRSYWLGEHPEFDQDYIEGRYRALKPCLHGSDAHREGTVGEPHEERFCWLKGDLTFETLRQAVVEPGQRVWIGQSPPSNAPPSYVVRRVAFEATPWLKKSSLELNGGLVAVIGARGSGKTALADIIATGAHSADAGKGDASFLSRAFSPTNYLGDAKVNLTWGDNQTSRRPLAPGPSKKTEEVRYLSQHFVERLCSSAGLANELRAAMEQVVYESTDPLERLEADNFEELANRLLEPIRSAYFDLQLRIDSIGDAIVHEEILHDKLGALKLQRATLAKKIEGAKKEVLKLIPKGNEERVKLLARLESACVAAQVKVEGLKRRQKTLDDLQDAATYETNVAEPTRFATFKQKFAAALLAIEEWDAFRMRYAGDTAKAIAAARARAAGELKAAQEIDLIKPVDKDKALYETWPLNLLTAERDAVKATVGIDAQQQKQYDSAQRQISADELALNKIDVQIQQAAGAAARRDEKVELRRALYAQVFELLVSEETVLNDLYAPLRSRLIGADGSLAKLQFVLERTVNLSKWCQRGEELFDLRYGNKFRGRDTIKKLAEKHLLDAWRTGSAGNVAVAMEQFRTGFQVELKKMPPWISADERRSWYKSVSSWLYDTEHIKLRYGIEYDGTPIERLSPGTRGVVLLLLYLAVDLYDQRPLIIDQPEENLDPNSVFKDLVPHFREARKRRQVIIVTHNANLVVNTDADQVIVASSVQQPGGGLPEIDYQTGSLENGVIRGAVCQLLEGGERAFLERERRYRLRWGHSLLEEPDDQESASTTSH